VRTHTVGVIRGDGTGPEVVGEALKVLETLDVGAELAGSSDRFAGRPGLFLVPRELGPQAGAEAAFRLAVVCSHGHSAS